MADKSLAEHLADVLHPEDISLNSSGTQVVYTLKSLTKKEEHASSSMWLAQFGEKHSARQISAGLFDDNSPQWSPDGKHIAFISDRADRGKSSAIYVIPLSGGEAYPITEIKNEKDIGSLAWSPDGKYIAYLSADEKTPEQKKKEEDKLDAKVFGEEWEYNRLRCVHVATKAVSTLVKGDTHVTKLAWCAASSVCQLVFVTQKTPEIDSSFEDGVNIQSISVGGGEAKHIYHFPDSIGDFVTDGESVAWNARRSSKVSTSNGSLFFTSIEGGGMLTGPLYGKDDCVNSVKAHGSKLYLKLMVGLSDQLIALNPTKVIYEEQHVLDSWDMLTTSTTTKAIFVKGDASHPSEVFSYDGTTLIQLSQHGSCLPNTDFGTATPFTCTASDGTLLDGILTLPNTPTDNKPYPTLVLIHGGPYDRVSVTFGMPYGAHWKWAPYFVAAGYAVLCPNYRGSAGRGATFAGQTLQKLATLDYSDVISLTRAGIERGIFDEKRIGVGGWSQGGFLSYLAVTRPETFQFKAAVCGAGVTDWDAMQMGSDIPTVEGLLSGTPAWRTDASNVDMRKASPLWHMKGVPEDKRTPVLILHGEKDDRIPVTQAWAFQRGCRSLAWDCTMVMYPREGHMITERAHVIDMLERMGRFYDLHLR